MLVPSGSEGCGISSRDFCSTSESSAATTDSDMAVSLYVVWSYVVWRYAVWSYAVRGVVGTGGQS
ncbi:hypothetical protein GCM10010306_031990 [Streptomyces umbrinus]|nr:hypothetical protein GCM10010306_031990 [Streptomyces umbrinus]